MAVQLIRVRPGQDPGISRQRTGSGFRYVMPDGSAPDAQTQKRIQTLAVPPAWTQVWITTTPAGHIQAVGIDARGRHQYRYHPAWRAEQQGHKFDRIVHLAAVLPAARKRVTRDLRQNEDGHTQMLAVAFRFLDDAAPRVGSISYLEEYGSRGLTTLLQRHASVDGPRVLLHFPAKSHRNDNMHMTDADLAVVVAGLLTDQPDNRLLRYTLAGRHHHLDEYAVNDYIRDVTGDHFTAKDFRTLRGTVVAAQTLAHTGAANTQAARHAAEINATKAASDALQNTPAVARSAYIDPRVFTAYDEGRTLDLSISPDTALRRLVRE